MEDQCERLGVELAVLATQVNYDSGPTLSLGSLSGHCKALTKIEDRINSLVSGHTGEVPDVLQLLLQQQVCYSDARVGRGESERNRGG